MEDHLPSNVANGVAIRLQEELKPYLGTHLRKNAGHVGG